MLMLGIKSREKLIKQVLSNAYKMIHQEPLQDIWRADITCPKLTIKTFNNKRIKELRCVHLQISLIITIITMVKTMVNNNHYVLTHHLKRVTAPLSPFNKHLLEPKRKLFSNIECQIPTLIWSISSRIIRRTRQRSISSHLYWLRNLRKDRN